MANEQQEIDGQGGGAPRRLSTPILVGSMAALIMAVVFVVAILRGGSGDPGHGRPGSGRAGAVASDQAGGTGNAPAGGGAPKYPKVEATYPRGPVPREGLVFKWSRVEGLDQYEVVLYDTLMKKVWTSPRVADQQLELPEKIMDYLRSGAPYHWKVIATSAAGRSTESASVTFRVIDSSEAS